MELPASELHGPRLLLLQSLLLALAQLVTPAITELHVDYADIGRKSAALMMGRLDGTIIGPPRVLKFATTLIKRESCAPPPVMAPLRKSGKRL